MTKRKPRRGRPKKTLADYSDAYAYILDHFMSNSNDFVIYGVHGELLSMRQTIYKYFGLVKEAHEANLNDRRLEDLFRISREVGTVLLPVKGEKTTPAKLIFKFDPLVKAVRSVSPFKKR